MCDPDAVDCTVEWLGVGRVVTENRTGSNVGGEGSCCDNPINFGTVDEQPLIAISELWGSGAITLMDFLWILL